MTRKILIAAVAVLLPTAAPAQPAPAAEKSSDEIRCDLGGDCNGAERTRSFSVMKRNSTQFSPALPAIPRRAPGAQPAPSHLVRPAPQPGPGRQAVPIRGSSSLSINFQSGAANLTEDGRRQADKVLAAIRAPELAKSRFIVGGHTDAVGNRQANVELSRRRAQALIDFLAERGVDPDRLEARGYGFDQPLPGTRPSDSANRRVEIIKVK